MRKVYEIAWVGNWLSKALSGGLGEESWIGSGWYRLGCYVESM